MVKFPGLVFGQPKLLFFLISVVGILCLVPFTSRINLGRSQEVVQDAGNMMWKGHYQETTGLNEDDFQSGNLYARLPTQIIELPDGSKDYAIVEGDYSNIFFRYDSIGCDGPDWGGGQAPGTFHSTGVSGTYTTQFEGVIGTGSYTGSYPVYNTIPDTKDKSVVVGTFQTEGVPTKTCNGGTEDEFQYSIGSGNWALEVATTQPGFSPNREEDIIVINSPIAIEIVYGAN